MSQQFELLAQKTIGDDVAGPFSANNSELNPNTKNGRFEGEAKFSENFESYADQTDADANWISTDTAFLEANAATNELDFDTANSVTNHAISFDLWSQGIFPSDTNWTLRFKFDVKVFTMVDNNLLAMVMGISDKDQTAGRSTVQDFIGVEFDGTLSTQVIRSQAADNAIISAASSEVSFDTVTSASIFFVEIKRTFDTKAEITLYSDADYSVIIEKVKFNPAATLVDLRYIKFFTSDTSLASTSTYTGAIDDISFFNDTEGLQNFLTIKGDLQTPVFDDSFDSYGSNITPNYVDSFADAAPWTTTSSTKLRIEPLQGFMFITALADTTAYAIAHDLGDQITTPTTFEDDFVADNWTDVGTNVFVNTGPQVMDFDNPPSSSFEDSSTIDMIGGGISNSAWTLRFKYTPSTITQGTNAAVNSKQEIQFVISELDSTNPVSTGQTFVGFRHTLESNNVNEYQLFFAFLADMRGNILPQIATDVPTAGVTRFFQLKRLTSTSCELKIFSDAAYQNLIETLSSAMSVNIQTLRYLKCNSWQGTGAFPQNDGQILGDIDDVQFWNNTVDIGGIISDTEWVMRAEINPTDIDNGGNNIDKKFYFGIFDSDETEDATDIQDGMFVSFNTDLVPGDRINIHAMNNNDPSTAPVLGTFNDTRLVPLLNQKYFLEMKRISTTDMQVGFYTDNTYSDAIEVITISTIPVNTINLRFVKVLNEPGSGTGNLDATVKNLEFWNSTNVTRTPIADSYVQQGTDISIDKERSLIDFDANVQNTLQMLTTDIIGASLGNVFSCRFKLVIKERVQGASSTAINLLIGLDQRDGTATLNQINTNFTGFRIRISSTVNEIRAISTSSSGGDDNPVTSTGTNKLFTTLPDPGTYYCEITKTADIFAIIKIWRDKDYTDIIEAILSSSQPNGSMRYFKVANGDAGGTPDSTLIGTVDDIQVWNIRDPDGYGMREYLHQSSLVKFASGTMQVADIVSGDNTSNPGGSNYISRHARNGAADVVATASEGVMATGMVDSDVFIESFMNQEFKSVNSLALAANNVGLNIPDRMVSIWRYQEFPQLEKLTLINSLGGLYGTDSTSSVWGSIPT